MAFLSVFLYSTSVWKVDNISGVGQRNVGLIYRKTEALQCGYSVPAAEYLHWSALGAAHLAHARRGRVHSLSRTVAMPSLPKLLVQNWSFCHDRIGIYLLPAFLNASFLPSVGGIVGEKAEHDSLLVKSFRQYLPRGFVVLSSAGSKWQVADQRYSVAPPWGAKLTQGYQPQPLLSHFRAEATGR